VRRSTAELTLPCINAQRVKAVMAISPLIASNMPSAITDKKSAKDVGTSDDEKSAPIPLIFLEQSQLLEARVILDQ